MRIRTLKPEFWSSEDIAALTEPAMLLAIGLLNYADDEGYFNANPALIKAALFPLREPSVSIHGALSECSNVGYIEVRKTADGRKLGKIVKFGNHQSINRPSKSKIKELFEACERSVRTHGALTEDSRQEQGTGIRDQGKEQGSGNVPDSRESGAQTELGYRTKKGRLVKGEQLEWFGQFWKAFAKTDGKAEAADAWLDLKVTAATLPDILKWAKAEAESRKALIASGLTPKFAQGWLSGRRWEKFVEMEKAKGERADAKPPDWEEIGKRYGLRWAMGEMFVDFQKRVMAAQRREHERGQQTG